MKIIKKTKETFDIEFRKIAKANIIRKLDAQGIDYRDLNTFEVKELLKVEIKILESDSKKVGAGIAIGIATSMLLGF